MLLGIGVKRKAEVTSKDPTFVHSLALSGGVRNWAVVGLAVLDSVRRDTLAGGSGGFTVKTSLEGTTLTSLRFNQPPSLTSSGARHYTAFSMTPTSF